MNVNQCISLNLIGFVSTLYSWSIEIAAIIQPSACSWWNHNSCLTDQQDKRCWSKKYSWNHHQWSCLALKQLFMRVILFYPLYTMNNAEIYMDASHPAPHSPYFNVSICVREVYDSCWNLVCPSSVSLCYTIIMKKTRDSELDWFVNKRLPIANIRLKWGWLLILFFWFCWLCYTAVVVTVDDGLGGSSSAFPVRFGLRFFWYEVFLVVSRE